MYVELDGPKVRELRGDRTAAEVASLAGITPETLRRVEREQGRVTFRTAHKIAAALEVNPPQQLGRAAWTRRSPAGRPTVEAHELHA